MKLICSVGITHSWSWLQNCLQINVGKPTVRAQRYDVWCSQITFLQTTDSSKRVKSRSHYMLIRGLSHDVVWWGISRCFFGDQDRLSIFKLNQDVFQTKQGITLVTLSWLMRVVSVFSFKSLQDQKQLNYCYKFDKHQNLLWIFNCYYY